MYSFFGFSFSCFSLRTHDASIRRDEAHEEDKETLQQAQVCGGAQGFRQAALVGGGGEASSTEETRDTFPWRKYFTSNNFKVVYGYFWVYGYEKLILSYFDTLGVSDFICRMMASTSVNPGLSVCCGQNRSWKINV